MSVSSEYHGDDYMFVYAGEQIDDSVRLHEISHQYLTKSTHWGCMIYNQVQLRRADRCYERIEYHTEIGNLLMQAAESTFESHATLMQLLYAKSIEAKEIDELLDSPYYKMYNKDYFQVFLSLDMPIMRVIELSQRLPVLALATDLLEIKTEDWKSKEKLFQVIMANPLKYYPDKRFACLVKAYRDLLDSNIATDITDNMLLEKSGLIAKTTTYDTPLGILDVFESLMKRAFENDFCIDEAFSVIRKTLIIGDMDDIIKSANHLDIPLPLEDYETYEISKLEAWLNDCPILILLPYNEKIILQYHIPMLKKRYVCVCDWEALVVLCTKFGRTILLYNEDYEYMKKKFPYLQNRRTFYYFEGDYKYFCKNLKNKGVEKAPAFLFKVNEMTYCIFVKGCDNEIFFTAQNQGGISLFIEDLQKWQFEYINLGGKKIDTIFYENETDWSVYEDAVKSVLHVNSLSGRCDLISR